MGAEQWLVMDSPEELERALAFLGEDLTLSQFKDGVWFQRMCQDDITEPVLEVGYSFGGVGDLIALFVCREVAKRFTITGIGTDSVGIYDPYMSPETCSLVEAAVPSEAGNKPNWVTYMQNLQAEWLFPVKVAKRYYERNPEDLGSKSYWERCLQHAKDVEVAVVAWFADRDVNHDG